MIATLDDRGGFGGSGSRRMQIDFSLHVVRADNGSAAREITAHSDGYYSPDCEPVGSIMPVPLNAAIEGHTGLVCDNENEDCHLLVVQGDTLYEAYRVTSDGNDQLEAQCLAVWQLNHQV